MKSICWEIVEGVMLTGAITGAVMGLMALWG